ncbi:putative DNA-binding protein [Micrococcus yunnanensis]|uniref:DNA-binding protein n=1 Tax=Micrococcus yunnanensis TaxID=566027 RepID=A0ABR6D3H9_9MICC|nr:putative DNA-binding protein [Micrococcus yunnanensis]
MPQELKYQLVASAKQQERTESAVMREALEEYVLA